MTVRYQVTVNLGDKSGSFSYSTWDDASAAYDLVSRAFNMAIPNSGIHWWLSAEVVDEEKSNND